MTVVAPSSFIDRHCLVQENTASSPHGNGALLVLRLICVSRYRGGVVKRGEGSDDDGRAVPPVYAALDPDDPEPVRAVGPAAGANRWSYNYDVYAVGTEGDHSPEVLFEDQHGEEKWREWSYDFRMATATRKATVFELLIGSRRKESSHGMETIDKEIFQHLVINTEGKATMLVKVVESADVFVAYSRLHAKLSRRTLARIMRIHKECTFPIQVKDVKLLTSATCQWEDKRNAMFKEMKDPTFRISGRLRRSWSCARMI